MQMLQGALLRAMPWVPRSVVRRLAGRYIAGETLDDLLRVVTELHGEGFLTTVDVLGENVTTEEAARAGMEEYLRAVERLAGAGLPSQVSVKLTLLGLRLGEDLARGRFAKITERAESCGISVCIDMEDSSTTDAILRIFRDSRERHSSVSVAIQAYLHRSEKDILGLLPLRPAIRVCKGIYNEPPGIAYQGRREIRESFLRLVRLLLDGGAFPAMATHDPWLVDRCLDLLRGRGGTSPAGTPPGRSPEGHEFQMLLGVGEKLRPRIRARSPIRLYCPYGPDWHAYSLRRLKENPRMVGYILKSVLSPSVLRKGRLG